MNNFNFSTFLEELGAFESGITVTQQYPDYWFDYLGVFDPARGGVDRGSINTSNPQDLSMLQYHVHNTLGFLGKYQFGEPLLIDLGYYTPAASGFYGSTATNEWQGTWTGKNGVESKTDFMSQAQELAICEAFAMNIQIIQDRLAQVGKMIDDFLGKEFHYTQGGVEHTAVVSMSGILASAHLQGPGGVANLLLNGIASSDEYGTNILSYMDKYGGFSTPFGTAANDTLTGSDYAETFIGGTGNNVYQTGGGEDLILIAKNPNATDTIQDFQVGQDVISLEKLGVKFANLDIHQQGSDTIINLANNQSITLLGVDAHDLTAANFKGLSGSFSALQLGEAVSALQTNGSNNNSSGHDEVIPVTPAPTPAPSDDNDHSGETYNFTWAWGNHDVIHEFDPGHDVVNLHSFWTSADHAPIYNDAAGNAVIDLTTINNQTITLDGVGAEQLLQGSVIR